MEIEQMKTGTITKIEKQLRNRDRYSIYIDHTFAFGVYEDTLVNYRLSKGMVIDEHLLGELMDEERQNKANGYALNLLSYRPRSEQEIKRKMKEKEYEEDIVLKTLSMLKKNNYLNDRNFATSFVRDRITLRKMGKGRLRQELYKKGIDKEIIEETLSQWVNPDEEYEMALELARKKLSTSYKSDDTAAQYRKLGGFLQRKGYDFHIISKILDQLLRKNAID